jgi:hypothetical protein
MDSSAAGCDAAIIQAPFAARQGHTGKELVVHLRACAASPTIAA